MDCGVSIDLDSPITKIKTIVFTKIEIKVMSINLNNSANIQVIIFNDDKSEYKIFNYIIDGIAYLDWTTDNYLYTWVKNKIKNENL